MGNEITSDSKFNELTVWATARCNFDCDYCFVYKKIGKQPVQDLCDDVIDVLPSFCKIWLNERGSIHFFGGEPLVVRGVIEKVYDKVHSVMPDVRFGLTTNASLLTEDVAKWLGERHFYVHLSIDGWKGTHNLHRKYPDGRPTWDEVYAGVENARAFISDSTLRWTVTEETAKNIYDDVIMCLKNGFKSIALEFDYDSEWSKEGLEALEGELRRVGNHLLVLAKNGKYVNWKPIEDVIAMFTRNKDDWMNRCGLAQGGVGVDVNGDIYPCHRFVATRHPNLVIGNVKTGIEKAKRENLWKEWKSSRPRHKDSYSRCLDCPLVGKCIGGCIASNYLAGNVHMPTKSYCDIENVKVKALLDVAFVMKGLK